MRAALTLALAGTLPAVAGCKASTDVTGLNVVSSWVDLAVDQLEFTCDLDGARKAGPSKLPNRPGKLLESGANVVIYLPDSLGGETIHCDVSAYSQGRVVATGDGNAHLVAHSVVSLALSLSATPGSKINGAPCTDAGECESGVCADGLCCETACAGVCLSCAVPGKQGTCSLVPEGVKHPSCADQGAASCRFDGTCDGRGACRMYPVGTKCLDGSCMGSSISAAGACDGEGHCAAGPVLVCAPFSCDSAGGMPRCYNRCDTSSQCVAGRECVSGTCGKKLEGASCTDAGECASGFCADGVCCDSKCDGPCVTCGQVGSVGTCRPSASGVKDPRGLCHDEGAASCGSTGTCDGSGGCARYSAGTTCKAAQCSSNTVLVTASKCDGMGQCIAGGPLACAPYACAGDACKSECTRNEDCNPMVICDLLAKSCGKKGLGQACTSGTDCGSGFCVDRVCCNEACQGACRSCTLGKTPGVCTMANNGASDPRNVCKDTGKASCGTDGTCNGAGACRKYSPGTVCGPGTCNATTNVRTMQSTCDSNGKCVAGASVGCGAYRCNGATCFSACSSDADCVMPNACIAGACTQRGSGAPCGPSAECVAPYTCIGSTCQLKPVGFACGSNSECSNKQCTDGFCCEAANCGTCRSCKVSGFVGFCHALSAGTADSRCTTDAPSTCRQDGKCDGNGACRLYAPGTECAKGSCVGTVRVRPKTCDGAGGCQDTGLASCDPYECNPATNDCYTSCQTDAECSLRKCKNNSCF